MKYLLHMAMLGILNFPAFSQGYSSALDDNNFPYRAAYALREWPDAPRITLGEAKSYPGTRFITCCDKKASEDNVTEIKKLTESDSSTSEFIFSGWGPGSLLALKSAVTHAEYPQFQGKNQIKVVIYDPHVTHEDFNPDFLKKMREALEQNNIMVFLKNKNDGDYLDPYVRCIWWRWPIISFHKFWPSPSFDKTYVEDAIRQTQLNYYDDQPNPGYLWRVSKMNPLLETSADEVSQSSHESMITDVLAPSYAEDSALSNDYNINDID